MLSFFKNYLFSTVITMTWKQYAEQVLQSVVKIPAIVFAFPLYRSWKWVKEKGGF